ncbi:MAG TPA: ABC transporter permease [Longimicrobium sp.]|jgi:predicted permease
METLLTTLLRAGRRLRRAPGFTAAAVLTLALGIGATAAVFTLVDAVLLRPLPYPAAERLVALRHAAPGLDVADAGLSDGTYLHYRAHNRVLEAMGVWVENVVNATDGDPERVQVALVTPGVFGALGVTPALGRLFTPDDALPDATPVVVISHAFWMRRYGGDPGIVGRSIELNRLPRKVVGVLPPAFDFPRPETQVWYALPVQATESGIHALYLGSVGRLRPGVSPAAAEADLRRLTAALPEAYGDATPELLRESGLRPVVVPLKEALVGDVRPALMILLCTAAFVLLIACANVATLFLARAERQQGEVAVERALGAGGVDLAARFLGEAMLVAGAGAALGLALAEVAVRARFGFAPGEIPRLHEVRVSAATMALVLTAAVVAAALPATLGLLRAARGRLTAALSGTRSTYGPHTRRVQGLLVLLQVALALALLIGSAVMVQSFRRLRAVELGFDPRSTLAVEVSLPFREYPAYQDGARFHHALLARLRQFPGVQAAEVAGTLPLSPVPEFLASPVAPDPAEAGVRVTPPMASLNLASPGYFAAMRIPLRRGRGFEPTDLAGGAPPVILSEALARALFRGENPVGRWVRVGVDGPAYAVAGVAEDVPGESLTGGGARALYFPVIDDPRLPGGAEVPVPVYPRDMTVVVRAAVPPATLAAAVRQAVRELDPKVPLARVRTLEEVVEAASARTRLTMLLLLAAAASALFLGVIGIYGLVSYTVGARTREIGVRLALGATPGAVRRMVVRQGVVLAAGGIAAGLLPAFALTRILRGLLYGVSPSSPAAYVTMSALLFVVVLGATFVPARRAGRVDPAAALKAE